MELNDYLRRYEKTYASEKTIYKIMENVDAYITKYGSTNNIFDANWRAQCYKINEIA